MDFDHDATRSEPLEGILSRAEYYDFSDAKTGTQPVTGMAQKPGKDC
jgi:hypothetical protein